MNIKPYILRFWNFWPPFLFSGIKVTFTSKDYRHIIVKLKLRFWTANYVGTQYGGSMFSMVDPFYMIMLIQNLGPNYIVWDKCSTIRYLKPGKSDVTAKFDLSEEEINAIRETVQDLGKMDWVRKVEIKDEKGDVVAEVDKTVFIKKRQNG